MPETSQRTSSRKKNQAPDLDTIGLEMGNKPPQALDVEEVIAQLLVAEGFNSVELIADSEIEDLEKIQGFNKDIATEIKERAIEFLKEEEKESDGE